MDEALNVEISRLEGLMSEILILPDTPELMSAGKLQGDGFSFFWAHGYLPCLISNKTHAIIAMDVCGGLPMIIQNGVFDKVQNTETILELCGVKMMKEGNKHYACLHMIDIDEDKHGLNKYEEIKQIPNFLSTKKYEEMDALAAKISKGSPEPADEEDTTTTPVGVTLMREQTEEIRKASERNGAGSSGGVLAVPDNNTGLESRGPLCSCWREI